MGSSALPHHVSRKRKYTSNVQSLGKRTSEPSTRLEACDTTADAPRHGVRKGLMTSQGSIVPPPLPLLVKDKEYVVDTARSVVWDANLDECSEH